MTTLVRTRSKAKRQRRSPRPYPHPITASDTKGMILGVANVLAGVFGVFEELEKGALVGDAIKKEIGRGRRRAKAVRDAEMEPPPSTEDEEEDP